MKKVPKSSIKYECKICDYTTIRKSQYDRHLTTAKHKNRTFRTEKVPKSSEIFECECGKTYTARNSLWYHKQRCNYDEVQFNNANESIVHEVDANLVVELLKQNQEFKEMIVEQNKKMSEQQDTIMELSKVSTVYNTTNNTTNNNRFNLNVFLNETCKDAMNLNDFIQSIELNVNDFINTGEVGYVKGISSIVVDRIKDMEPHVRPIHCTDLKRETVYVKDSDKWAKEDENKTHIRKAVRIVADKNQAQVHPWIKENPNYEILDTPECDKYFEYTKASLGGYGREEDRKFENKIINNILKETVINKKMIE